MSDQVLSIRQCQKLLFLRRFVRTLRKIDLIGFEPGHAILTSLLTGKGIYRAGDCALQIDYY
jgi:hypothetical protein